MYEAMQTLAHAFVSLAETFEEIAPKEGRYCRSDKVEGAIAAPGYHYKGYLDFSSYGKEEKRCIVQLHLVITHHRNVFLAAYSEELKTKYVTQVNRDRMFAVPDLEHWVNTSNHDSCWRSDGVESPVYETGRKMKEQIESEYSRVSPLIRLGGWLTQRVFQPVVAHHVAVNPNDSYRRKLVLLEEV